jgi:type III restriction enzyme
VSDKWKALIMLNMGNIIEHLKTFINITQGEAYEIIYNDPKRIFRSTSDLQTWHTSKEVINLTKTHINFIPVDSKMEAIEAQILQNSDFVDSFVKNDHLHFIIWYTWEGQSRRYYPDFLVKLRNGKMLVLETKGIDDEQNRIKRKALQEWIIAVNANHKEQQWYEAISFKVEDLPGILENVYLT